MPSPASKRELRAGTLLGGKYKLRRQLGRGASGVLWAAINVATSREVALKLLLRPEPKACERLLREARAAGALKHPNVLDVYDVIVTEDGSPALVLELLEGQTLQELIFERAPLPQAEAAGIGRDVARALAIAHASGIIHRDLKPANIFLHRPGDEPPVVKVVDFGISKNLLAGEGTLTETGTAVGTPSFMSPEQVRGEKVDGRTDLWALGVILLEMLSGQRLFDGRPHEVLTRVLVQPLKPVEEVVVGLDPAFARVLRGLLERDLDKRLTSADEVAEWLATIATAANARGPQRTEPPPGGRGEAHDTAAFTVPPSNRSVRPAAKSSAPPAASPSVAPPSAKGTTPSSAKGTMPPAAKITIPAAAKITMSPDPKITVSTAAKGSLPKIHEDEDDDEATHVAPATMRRALAFRAVPKVPSVYVDEEEEEPGDRTRVAGDAELTDAIKASREPRAGAPGEGDAGESDQNTIPTVRPQALPMPTEAEAPVSKRGAAAKSAGEKPAAEKAAGGEVVAKKVTPESAAVESVAVEKAASSQRPVLEEILARKAAAEEAIVETASHDRASGEKAIAEDTAVEKAPEEEAGRGSIWIVAAIVFVLVVVAIYLLVQRALV